MTFSIPPLGNPNIHYAIPINSRRKPLLATLLRSTLTLIVFGTGCIGINTVQVSLLPLKFFPPTRSLYANGQRYIKATGATLFSEFFSLISSLRDLLTGFGRMARLQ